MAMVMPVIPRRQWIDTFAQQGPRLHVKHGSVQEVLLNRPVQRDPEGDERIDTVGSACEASETSRDEYLRAQQGRARVSEK